MLADVHAGGDLGDDDGGDDPVDDMVKAMAVPLLGAGLRTRHVWLAAPLEGGFAALARR